MAGRSDGRYSAGEMKDYARSYQAIRDSTAYNERLAKAMMRCVSDELVKYRPISWVTPAARDILKSGELAGIEVEHAIPVSIIHKRLLSARKLEPHEIEAIIRDRIVGVLVTKAEHKILNKKLRQKMPDGWVWETGDRFARYKAVGLEVFSYP